MPDLQHLLNNYDLGFLNIIADLWGVDIMAPDARHAHPILARKLLDSALVLEVVEALPDGARAALDRLVQEDGWMAWSRFTREFGPLREMGPGRRDREQPHLAPASPVEVLWYRALIGRDFLKREGKLQECAYISDDLLACLPQIVPAGPQLPGRPSSPGEIAHIIPVSDRILDHTCTLLAALRLGEPERSPAVAAWNPSMEEVHALLAGMKLITSSEQPVLEDARPFLSMPRGEALSWLFRGWQTSTQFNELRLMPGIVCEGAWVNDPLLARGRIFELLGEVPEGAWWNLGSFIDAIRQRDPDYQRPAGDFDSWLVRDSVTGKALQGIEHWEKVDGALIRYLITGPMHWLGMIDLAAPEPKEEVTAFRFSDWANDLLLGRAVRGLPDEEVQVEALSDGRLIVSPHTPRLARYQLSRFCQWMDETADAYIYQLTPTSLSDAAEQGLKAPHLETLLKKYGKELPPSLLKALQNWDRKGGQARIFPAVVLQIASPKILQALRDSPAARFLGDPLSPTAVIVQQGAVEKVRAALARLGTLSDVELTEVEDMIYDETDGSQPDD